MTSERFLSRLKADVARAVHEGLEERALAKAIQAVRRRDDVPSDAVARQDLVRRLTWLLTVRAAGLRLPQLFHAGEQLRRVEEGGLPMIDALRGHEVAERAAQAEFGDVGAWLSSHTGDSALAQLRRSAADVAGVLSLSGEALASRLAADLEVLAAGELRDQIGAETLQDLQTPSMQPVSEPGPVGGANEWLDRARHLLRGGELNGARSAYRTALERDATLSDARLELAWTLLEDDLAAEALDEIALSGDSSDEKSTLLRGRALEALGRLDDAQQTYTAALERSLADSRTRGTLFHMRALVHMNAERWQEAISDCGAASALLPGDPAVLLLRAGAHEALRNVDAALKDVNSVLLLDPREARGYVLRGKLLLARRQPVEATADLSEAIALDPTGQDGLAFDLRGAAALDLQVWPSALEDLTVAEHLDPRAGEPGHFSAMRVRNRSAAWEALGERDQARQDCQRALELAPPDWPARGDVQDRLKRLDASDSPPHNEAPPTVQDPAQAYPGFFNAVILEAGGSAALGTAHPTSDPSAAFQRACLEAVEGDLVGALQVLVDLAWTQSPPLQVQAVQGALLLADQADSTDPRVESLRSRLGMLLL
ncbi:hypothetical protein OAX78_00260 [Planctomycetota bacterium]|nr:hypothetical protein [Planctomycetota bacterium]